MKLDRYYCPKCRKFLKRRNVRFVEHFLPHYICSWCGTEVIDVRDVLEKIVEEKIVKGEWR